MEGNRGGRVQGPGAGNGGDHRPGLRGANSEWRGPLTSASQTREPRKAGLSSFPLLPLAEPRWKPKGRTACRQCPCSSAFGAQSRVEKSREWV